MKRSVLTFVAALLLCLAGLEATAQSDNFVPVRYWNISGVTDKLKDSATVSGSYYRHYWVAPDSMFATSPIVDAGADSGTVTAGTISVHTVTGFPSTVRYLRILSRTSPSGPWDTSAAIRLKRPPTVHATVTPGSNSFTAAVTAYTGNDVVPVYCVIYYDSAHTACTYFDTFYVAIGVTTTVTVATPSYLAPGAWYYPRFYTVASEGTAIFDTAIQMHPLPGPATVDTAAATVITDHSVTMYLKANTIGLAGYLTVQEYDSLSHIIDSVHIPLAASYADQYFTVTFDTLHAGYRYKYNAHAVASAGTTWTSSVYYVTRTTSPELSLDMVSAGQSSYSGLAEVVLHYHANESIGLCDVTVLLAYGTPSNVVDSRFHPGMPGDSTIIDAFMLDAHGTYYAFAQGHDTSMVNSDTLVFGAWPTGIKDVSAIPERATVTITNMTGQKVDEYATMPNEPLWRKDAQYVPGIYVATVRTESGIFQQKHAFSY